MGNQESALPSPTQQEQEIPAEVVQSSCMKTEWTRSKPGGPDKQKTTDVPTAPKPATRLIMSTSFPYTYISCPCVDTSVPVNSTDAHTRASEISVPTRPQEDSDEDEERTFDPRAPRSSYALYPLENLLFCEDCHQIRCPRCVLDEVVCWYCPNCLFEVPSTMARNEGNRNIAGQLAKIYSEVTHGADEGPKSPSDKESQQDEPRVGATPPAETRPPNQGSRFSNLKKFYASQLMDSPKPGSSFDLASTYGSYGSPGTLSRIMSLYSGAGNYGSRKAASKPSEMREAYGPEEGVKLVGDEEEEVVTTLHRLGWDATTSAQSPFPSAPNAQSAAGRAVTSSSNPSPKSKRPVSGSGSLQCTSPLLQSEPSPSRSQPPKTPPTNLPSLQPRNYLPTIRLLPLPSKPSPTPSVPNPSITPLLTPHTPTQYLLHLTNPLYDPIHVSLATPTHTPGRIASKITILCPQFSVGANTDVWDEALGASISSSSASALSASHRGATPGAATTAPAAAADGTKQAEAGKVWDKGRNWTSVVVEIVPGGLLPTGFARKEGKEEKEGELGEDEDVLEIPVFVRCEWEAVVEGGAAGVGAEESAEKQVGKERRERREVAYWCVVGVGRVAV
ncbi:MAG: hypothetical protein M1833_000624 [Piccolia ochrophora]|nr:MAG: hypothetical protein M1833_000624 [Piccolia ochrophora]